MGQAVNALTPRIYVACQAAYRRGCLYGVWIEVEDDEEAVWAEIRGMLASSPVEGADAFAIHDHEGFGAAEIGDHAGIDQVVALARFLRARGVLGGLVLRRLGGDMAAAQAALDDQYGGVFSNLADGFRDRAEKTRGVPDSRGAIDYEALAREALARGEIFTVETAADEIHVFWTR